MMRDITLAVLLVAMFSATACGGSAAQQPSEPDSGGDQQGYLAVYTNEVDFIQWAKSNNSISGNLQILSVDDEDSSQAESENLGFTGTLSDEEVSLTFPTLDNSMTWTGTLKGETLTLTIPGESGTLDTLQMDAASVSEYNAAAENFRRSLEQQDAQESSTQQSPCPYGFMPSTGPDGITCSSEGGRYEETEAPQTTIEDTSVEISCDDFGSAAGDPSQFQAQQFYDSATPEEQAILDEDTDGFACDDIETGVDELGDTGEG